MKVFKISDSQGSIHKIEFPENLSETSLNAKVAFDVCREDIVLWAKDSLEDEVLYENRTYYLYLISKALSEFLDYPIYQIMKLPADSLVDAEGELLPGVLQNHFDYLDKAKKDIDIDTADNVLTALYNNVVSLCDSYTFEFKDATNFTFNFAGFDWEIPYVVKTIYSGKKLFSKFSVAQSVEILQIKKFINDLSRPESDTLKNIRFSSFLKMLCFTVNKVGESFPLDDIEFQRQAEERMVLFQDIDVKTAYDVCFFLTTIMVN